MAGRFRRFVSHLAGPVLPRRPMRRCGIGLSLLLGAAAAHGAAATAPVHGLWVWQGPALLHSPQASSRLRDFCRAAGITEVYVSVLSQGRIPDPDALSSMIGQLHDSHVRVEALLSSTDADEPGAHRQRLLEHVGLVVEFNQHHPRSAFDGLHLDIEPQQRPENKGAGNLGFLPDLVQTLRAVRARADAAGLSVNADIQPKLLKAPPADRRAMLQSVPRLTLMLYGLGGAGDGAEAAAQKLRTASRTLLTTAYADLEGPELAGLVIGLRTADYGALLPQMLATLDEANGGDPRYQGWAQHSYNDLLKSRP